MRRIRIEHRPELVSSERIAVVVCPHREPIPAVAGVSVEPTDPQPLMEVEVSVRQR
jgi:hypothetical protein